MFFNTSLSTLGVERGPESKLSERVDFDLKNGREGNESKFPVRNSVWVGASPSGSIAETGMASMTHCIRRGPLYEDTRVK